LGARGLAISRWWSINIRITAIIGCVSRIYTTFG
jgi:hypothetical protein